METPPKHVVNTILYANPKLRLCQFTVRLMRYEQEKVGKRALVGKLQAGYEPHAPEFGVNGRMGIERRWYALRGLSGNAAVMPVEKGRIFFLWIVYKLYFMF